MENYKFKDITEEQRKKLIKITNKARWNLVWIAIKFAVGLFISNLAAVILGFFLFKDSDPQIMTQFDFIAMCTNSLFMYLYLNRQIKNNDVTMNSRILEVLKK